MTRIKITPGGFHDYTVYFRVPYRNCFGKLTYKWKYVGTFLFDGTHEPVNRFYCRVNEIITNRNQESRMRRNWRKEWAKLNHNQ